MQCQKHRGHGRAFAAEPHGHWYQKLRTNLTVPETPPVNCPLHTIYHFAHVPVKFPHCGWPCRQTADFFKSGRTCEAFARSRTMTMRRVYHLSQDRHHQYRALLQEPGRDWIQPTRLCAGCQNELLKFLLSIAHLSCMRTNTSIWCFL